MSFFQEIALTFTGMPLLAILALVLGIIFIILEVFVSGFHVFGIIGAILSIAGIVIRAFYHIINETLEKIIRSELVIIHIAVHGNIIIGKNLIPVYGILRYNAGCMLCR